MKTYIILGMGRSGTSFLAKALKDQGVNIGNNFWGRENPHGGFEDWDFVKLNKVINGAGKTLKQHLLFGFLCLIF